MRNYGHSFGGATRTCTKCGVSAVAVQASDAPWLDDRDGGREYWVVAPKRPGRVPDVGDCIDEPQGIVNEKGEGLPNPRKSQGGFCGSREEALALLETVHPKARNLYEVRSVMVFFECNAEE